jgi:hypothetical protein
MEVTLDFSPAKPSNDFNRLPNADAESCPKLLSELMRWGDRTSSLMTAYPGFEDFRCGGVAGRIRYARVPKALGRSPAWVGATEPIAPTEFRALFVREFFREASRSEVNAFLMPVSDELSRELTGEAHRICVGAEPVFDLRDERFSNGLDESLKRFPRARSLLKRGYELIACDGASLETWMRSEFDRVELEWKRSLKSEAMGFLNQVKPWYLSDTQEKRYFILKAPDENRIVSCLTALRVPAKNAWYFAEVFRSDGAPHGSTPLLMFGAMVKLREMGASAVRLGMCPLAYSEVSLEIQDELVRSGVGRLLNALSRRDVLLYGFRSTYEFKKRLKPSSWEPLFLISSSKPSFALLWQVGEAHFPERGLLSAASMAVQKRLDYRIQPFLSEVGLLSLRVRQQIWPLRAAAATIILLLLEVWRHQGEFAAKIFEQSTYMPSMHRFGGWILGPLFHNHAYHFWGDWISFIFFGSVLEWLVGRTAFLAVMALGFWLTNPVAEGLVRTLHALDSGWILTPEAWLRFLQEQDRGSSNAVYAFVGGLASFGKRNVALMLLAPFVLNGIYLCWVRESWLSLHHLVGLFAGWMTCRLALRHSGRDWRAQTES